MQRLDLVLLLCITSFTLGASWQHQREAKKQHEHQLAQQREADQLTAKLTQSKSDIDGALKEKTAALNTQLQNEQESANAQHNTLDAGLRAGTLSVRVPIVPASCVTDGVPAPRNPPAANQATHAQLDPKAAADLADIPHDGDAAIRDLNACIEQYNAVKDAFEQWRQTLQQQEVKNAQAL